MLPIHIDPHSGVPAYRQIMNQIKHLIAASILVPGSQLPSIRELAKQLTVNPTTIVKAYDELTHGGTTTKIHGKGVFVSEEIKLYSDGEIREHLKILARQMVIDGTQMGAKKELIEQIIAEELDLMNGGDSNELRS